MALVERVHQRDASPDLISLLHRELRDIGNEDRVKLSSDLQVVRRPKRLVAEVLKGEPGYVHFLAAARNFHAPAVRLYNCVGADVPRPGAYFLLFSCECQKRTARPSIDSAQAPVAKLVKLRLQNPPLLVIVRGEVDPVLLGPAPDHWRSRTDTYLAAVLVSQL